jgi:hypothetical protein
MPISTSASSEAANPVADDIVFPTETEIYILPDGRVIVADLPAELAPLVEQLGEAEPCEIAPVDASPVDSPDVDALPYP